MRFRRHILTLTAKALGLVATLLATATRLAVVADGFHRTLFVTSPPGDSNGSARGRQRYW